ncbi:MAG: potassium-transporting ATPase subunit KdpA [Geminicoccaceae bacterium]
MTFNGWVQILVYALLLLTITPALGAWMVRVYDGRRTWLSVALGPVERGFYRLAGVDPASDQPWTVYAFSMLAFSLVSVLAVYALLRVQNLLPLNPQDFDAVGPLLAFNTAVSFASNTNWQNYGGESTMSYLAQMAALTVQNFASAAVGVALAVALIRGFARRSAAGIGNFWADLVRGTLYVLLPISLVLAIALVATGVVQNLDGYVTATTLDGGQQVLAQGPVASQLAIKQLGTNGGGFLNANSAHPYENPTAVSNLLEMLAIFAIPAALTWVFGSMVGDRRQGWALFAAMAVVFLVGVGVAYWAEAQANPALTALGVDGTAGNMEGKETRFGIVSSALFAVITTAASCGAVNAMHDSFMPLGGMVPMVMIQLGEVIFGGVGSGLYGILLYAILAVFIAGLMVGRTPEYLGKKIESREVKLAILAMLAIPLGTLVGTALGLGFGSGAILNPGPHGFSEMLYAYSSTTGNNGSAFAGLGANTPLHNVLLGLAMLIGRWAIIVPMLAIAGSVAAKKTVPASPGTFPTTGPLFVALLVGIILIVGGLTFFPALALGPVVDHLALMSGRLF